MKDLLKNTEISPGGEIASDTPLMRQYNEIKARYPDALLLFRVGDFYETFGRDAVIVSGILGIVLTKRHNGSANETELAGFPHHSLENYMPRLVRAGYRVAVCDQLEDPKLAKKIVKRGVTELVTPGVAFSDNVLDQKKNNFLAAVHFGKSGCGVAFADISTGEFYAGEGTTEIAGKLLQSYQPGEVLHSTANRHEIKTIAGENFYTYKLEEWVFSSTYAHDLLYRHFNVKNLKGFGIESMPEAIIAAGAVLHYLEDTQQDRLKHLSAIGRIDNQKYMWLDRFTMRNLELLESPNSPNATLFSVLDYTSTPMGARMLRRWIAFPLLDEQEIKHRHEAVEYLKAQNEFRDKLQQLLAAVGDMERLVAKVSAQKCSPREMAQLNKGLQKANEIKNLLLQHYDEGLKNLATTIEDPSAIINIITGTLTEDPPAIIGKGDSIKSDAHPELNELRTLRLKGKDYLQQIQEREIEATGIPSLKIAFNNVYGYYLEVRHTHKDKVPETWIRKQTLTQAERYITEELKIYEEKILGAEDKILLLETEIYRQLLESISGYTVQIQHTAAVCARLDCLQSFAMAAVVNNYVRPEITHEVTLEILQGRHPVIEKLMPPGEKYVPNDVIVNASSQQIIMITGPNMAGKSALLRQTALLALMAQTGSFVPAQAAKVGIVDKLFSRVGASDNLAAGESTFMVEMNETASILNNLSERSLVILDEIGRGTSTYDGISIAWAIAEYIHQHPRNRARTLFATHYHELNEMADHFPRIKNYNVSIREAGNKILFLRKLEPGGTNHSFGIHVAKLAGMPNEVIAKANAVLRKLEGVHVINTAVDSIKEKPTHSPIASRPPTSDSEGLQLSFFQLDDPVLEAIREQIKGLDINNLTPVEALMKLNEIKKISGL